MKLMITGHRFHKLVLYDRAFIEIAIEDILKKEKAKQYLVGLSGMASGVDIWFCISCVQLDIPFIACPPFPEQANMMHDNAEKDTRERLLSRAKETKPIRNSKMVELADMGIVVWDGNKGGTHNVLQQLIENKKGFYWINPVSEKIFECI